MKVVITGTLTDEMLNEKDIESIMDVLAQYGIENIRIDEVEETQNE